MAMKPIEILINAKDNASAVFDSLKARVMAVGVAILGYFGVQAFAGAVKGAADFEEAMSRVQAATGASAAEMATLRKAAEDAGANTKFTSAEAADALAELGKAGVSAKDAIATLPAVLNLAQAGTVELGRSGEIMTQVVMGMGLAFSDAGRVADVLVKGADSSKTSVEGLAQALSYVAPVANSMGVSLESTVAIIGQFAQGGIDASRAGTALNSIMSQFGDPASKFRQELGAAGITSNNFEEALHQLAKAGPTGAKAINAVGLEAGPALRAMLNLGMGALDDLTAKLKNAEGSAAATAKVMNDNLNGSLKGLESAWKYVKDTLGAPVLPVLKDGVDQLAAAFRSAVSDGTIQKFGEAIATSFQSGIKWVREFAAQVDFKQVTADLRAFADRSGEVFTQIGEYASNAGNIVKTVYGVMSAGTNVVLGAVYGIGEAFAGVASNIQSGLALLMDGYAKITFGKVSAGFKAAADEIRLSAEATWAASEALGAKSSAAFLSVADGAQLARDGFTGLSASMTAAKPAADAVGKAIDDVGTKLEATRQKSQQAEKATNDKKAADVAATVAVRQLKDEYAALIASGNLQAATEKFLEINKALEATPAAAKKSAKSAEELAKDLAAAFAGLNIQSQASLKSTADSARVYYDRIKADGTSTAIDIGNAFKAYAEKAIAANNGVATETIKSEAAMRGLEIQTDSAGKSVVKAMGEGQAAAAKLGEQVKLTAEQVRALEDAQDRLAMKYKLSSDYTERQIALIEKENALVERRNALERERLNIDKEGYSLNTAGQRVNVAVESQASIYQRAKDSGLTEAQALELSKKTALPYNGPGLKVASSLDDGSNWSTNLQKKIDQLVLTNAAGSTSGAQTKTYRVVLESAGKSEEFNLTSDADAQRLVAAFQNARLTAS